MGDGGDQITCWGWFLDKGTGEEQRQENTMNKVLHPKANMYLPRNEKGRLLTQIQETVETEEYELLDYVKETNKQGQHQGTQNQILEKKNTAWTMPQASCRHSS